MRKQVSYLEQEVPLYVGVKEVDRTWQEN